MYLSISSVALALSREMMNCKNVCAHLIRESRMLSRCRGAAAIKRDCSKTSSASSEGNERTTHFGFQTIGEDEKAKEGERILFHLLLKLRLTLLFDIFKIWVILKNRGFLLDLLKIYFTYYVIQ